jgi:hypothetical protein
MGPLLQIATVLIPALFLLVEWAGRSEAQARDADSRAWYVLSQSDTNGLLLGLPERLGKTLLPLRQATPMWYGVDNGGRLALDVQVEGGAKGEITIGFFADPRWWLAEPVQVRQVIGPGRYTFNRLIPGKYRLGAMLGVPPQPTALGVHATWPAPIEITAGRTAEARVLLSGRFQNYPAGLSALAKDFAGQWDKMDPTRLITVRTVDSAGKPVPFCRVTFVDRGDGTQTLSFHDAGTDNQGYAYCDKIDRAFSLCVQRYDFLPERLARRYESRKMATLYNAQDRPVITVKWDDRFPTGTGRLVGQVHDVRKQPLKEFYLTLTRNIGEQHDWSDATSYAISLPIIQLEGRFEVGDLPPGTYIVMVRHFDYSAYCWTFDGPTVTIPDSSAPVVKFDVEVEAKELLYGRAVHQDGTPVYPGSWTAWSKKDVTDPRGGENFSMRTEKDGSFRIALSREERRRLIASSRGMIDVSASAPAEVIQVPINDLSKDPKQPFMVIVPKPKSSRDR